MKSKSIVFSSHYDKEQQAQVPDHDQLKEMTFDYGDLTRLPVFKGTHPAVLHERISAFDWEEDLEYSGKRNRNRPPHKHEKLRYRIVSFIEKYLLSGRPVGEFKNYKLIRR
jgi:hypothetical protein